MADSDNNPEIKPVKYKLDWIFVRRLSSCIKIIFPYVFHTSSLLFVMLLGFSLGQQLTIYNVGLIPSQFYEVLGDKDLVSFKPLLLHSIILIVSIAVANACVKLLSGLLYVQWRRLLCTELHAKYFANLTYYKLNVLKQCTLDNVDQRITQDVDRFCKQLSEIIAKLLISPLTIIYYSYQCFKNAGYIGPVSIYVYFVLGTIVNRVVMSPIVNLVVTQERLEGDFRFSHMDLRSNAESAAFYRSGATEKRRASRLLERLVNTQQRIVYFELFLNICIGLFDYLGSVLSYVVISVPIFAGSYDNLSSVSLGSLISENAFVSMYLINCFTSLMDLANKVTDLAGYTHRIGELLSCLVVCNRQHGSDSQYCVDEDSERHKCDENDAMIVCELINVSYCAPSADKPLVRALSFRLVEGKNMLVIGSAGCGKTSLLRLLANLWTPSTGCVQRYFRICPTQLMFLPQKPFMTSGSLAAQVMYPLDWHSKYGNESDDDMYRSLDYVGLTSLVQRCDGIHTHVDWNWYDVLSPGEMQRLTFARLFYHRPQFAVLDEPTSALGDAEEECCFTRCKQLGITYMTVGHRDTLRLYHDARLRIDSNGRWSLEDLVARED